MNEKTRTVLEILQTEFTYVSSLSLLLDVVKKNILFLKKNSFIFLCKNIKIYVNFFIKKFKST
jgi:hypothetical protein